MKSRLQKKEFFVPFGGGADTSGDPKASPSPTSTAENVDFNTDGVAKKREALGTLIGNTASDSPTAFSNDKYIGRSGSTVIFFGKDCYERTSNGSYSNCLAANNGSLRVIDIDRDFLYSAAGDASGVLGGSRLVGSSNVVACNSATGGQLVIIGYSYISAVDSNSRVIRLATTSSNGAISSIPATTNGVYVFREDLS